MPVSIEITECEGQMFLSDIGETARRAGDLASVLDQGALHALAAEHGVELNDELWIGRALDDNENLASAVEQIEAAISEILAAAAADETSIVSGEDA